MNTKIEKEYRGERDNEKCIFSKDAKFGWKTVLSDLPNIRPVVLRNTTTSSSQDRYWEAMPTAYWTTTWENRTTKMASALIRLCAKTTTCSAYTVIRAHTLHVLIS